jgi:hypothetical protein
MHDPRSAAAAHAIHFLADVPNPGTGIQPPGTAGLVTILQWVAWVVCGICVAGVLMVAGRMAVMHNRGEGGQHMVGIAYVLGACVLVGAASALVGALV